MAGKPKPRFGDELGRYSGVKRDNGGEWVGAKVALRRAALEAAPGGAVLDCFAGTGMMWREVWRGAAGYQGVELDPAKAMAHPAGGVMAAKAEDALGSLDLSRFSVFDFDAYGSPWREVAAMAARRRLAPGERVALALTDGSIRNALMGKVTAELADLAGVGRGTKGAHWAWTGLARVALVEAARRMGGVLVAMKQSDINHQSKVIWHGMAVLEGR